MTTKELVKINKDFFVKVASNALKTGIFAALPYLNIPPINYLINRAVDWLVGVIADNLELLAFFVYVDLRIDSEGKDYVSAAYKANKDPSETNMRAADEAFKRFCKFSNI